MDRGQPTHERLLVGSSGWCLHVRGRLWYSLLPPSTHHSELICSNTTSPGSNRLGSSLSVPYSTSISVEGPVGDFTRCMVLLTKYGPCPVPEDATMPERSEDNWLRSKASLLSRSPCPLCGLWRTPTLPELGPVYRLLSESKSTSSSSR